MGQYVDAAELLGPVAPIDELCIRVRPKDPIGQRYCDPLPSRVRSVRASARFRRLSHQPTPSRRPQTNRSAASRNLPMPAPVHQGVLHDRWANDRRASLREKMTTRGRRASGFLCASYTPKLTWVERTAARDRGVHSSSPDFRRSPADPIGNPRACSKVGLVVRLTLDHGRMD